MSGVGAIFLSMMLLFVFLLLFKRKSPWSFCAICLSVSLTWVGLLILAFLDFFENPVMTAILMGQSIVGVYYLLEKKMPERLQVFRLPFLLTATYATYVAVLGIDSFVPDAAVGIIGLWLVLLGVYWYRSHPAMKRIFDQIVACCKEW